MNLSTSSVAILAAATVGGAGAAEPAIPIADLFRLPQYADMKIAPDGKHLAALVPHKGRQNLVLLDLTGRKADPITASDAVDVVSFEWVNSKRLLFWTGELNERDDTSRRSELFAVDRDGTSPYRISAGRRDAMSRRDLMGGSISAVLRPLFLVRRLPGESDEIIAQEVVYDSEGRVAAGNLFRFNTRTGQSNAIGTGKPDSGESESWIVGNDGVPRGFAAYRRGTVAIYYRASADSDWIKVDERPQSQPGITPLAVDAAGLYVGGHPNRDTEAIYKWSAEKRALGEPIAAHPRADLRRLIQDEGGVVGVAYSADRPGVAWFDAEIARVQNAIDAALPGQVNRISWSRDRSRYLVHSGSDVSPGSFYLFDRKSGKLEWLADRAPWIDPARMAPTGAVRYAARDGLEIPAYLTIPRGASGKKLPLVVLVHGGPWVRGAHGMFDPEVQFFASRGYAVLQPNFRGTTGYGWKHFSSSFKQWGLAMQDDVTDGVLWAIEKGVADKDRICVYGASYGGYAAMMGLVKTPELYRCAVNYVGVTDVATMLTATWSDFAFSDFVSHLAREIVGDPDRERAALDAISPAKQAAKIRAPVLMAYGAADRRVPLVHGDMMRSALTAANKPHEWMVFDGEGHGLRRPENLARFYGAVERFLEEHLGR